MADYSSLKVPELKKLLAEKKLPLTGNKADLIARLQDDDKKNAEEAPAVDEADQNKEDEINYSDDETAAKAAEPKATEEPANEPANEPAAEVTAAPTIEATEEPAEESGEKPATEETAKEPAPSFALGLSSTAADEELKKRADRAKRFGLELDDEGQKLAERAKRFGINDKELATSLDSALPEKSLKRGRGRNEGDGNRPGKRHSEDRRGGERRSGRNRGNHQNQNRAGNGGAAKPKQSNVLNDPAEKAKAEKRAARFASS